MNSRKLVNESFRLYERIRSARYQSGISSSRCQRLGSLMFRAQSRWFRRMDAFL